MGCLLWVKTLICILSHSLFLSGHIYLDSFQNSSFMGPLKFPKVDAMHYKADYNINAWWEDLFSCRCSKRKKKQSAWIYMKDVGGLSCSGSCVWLTRKPSKQWWSSEREPKVGLLGWWVYSGQSLQWRHNGHDSVSNHQTYHCLLNRLFSAVQRKYQSSASLAFVRGIHQRPVNSPHKWPVMRKMFPFDDVIMVNSWM